LYLLSFSIAISTSKALGSGTSGSAVCKKGRHVEYYSKIEKRKYYENYYKNV
jgi:hypothetical protein